MVRYVWTSLPPRLSIALAAASRRLGLSLIALAPWPVRRSNEMYVGIAVPSNYELTTHQDRSALRKDAGLVVAQDLARRSRTFGRPALHEALEVLRAVLTREVTLAGGRVRLPSLLVAAELRVLAHLPVRVRTPQVRIVERHVERRAAVPVFADTWEHRLELAQESPGKPGRDRWVACIAAE